MKKVIQNLALIDQLIIGRVEPQIYAFSTNSVPNYLKVGDTYRPVVSRLEEWRRIFPDLEKQFVGNATVAKDIYFRDFAVHNFLENDLGKQRLKSSELARGVYFSREFFANTTKQDIKKAIDDITASYASNSNRYEFYNANERLPAEFHFQRGDDWTPRPNQQAVIDRFVKAVKEGRTNLLMYAVMRFGKSFTSLCCAKSIQANKILVVSGKADVKFEWKKTVELAGNFDGYNFLDAESLMRRPDALAEIKANKQVAVVFLTLQDLQGSEIKAKHKEIFDDQIDLLIVDETHFGARASEYGRILKDDGQSQDDRRALKKGNDDQVEAESAYKQVKSLDTKVRLHLSGTPYRILMGSEFSEKDIVAFVQFSDIVKEKNDWDKDHLVDDAANEWDNPYFGFPEMIRFAFNPNASSQKKLTDLRKKGVTFAFSALFEPQSIKLDKEKGLHKQYKHNEEILELLKVIDGSAQDENLLSFLDYDRIKSGKMCRHIVIVLPYCASCDAMQELIESNKETFKNLGAYNLINISGVEGAKKYKNPEQVKRSISQFDAEGAKTLTLTVNRMLTGSTVEEWDTMIYLKDTASPQEYDQATFRLQNQFVRELRNKESKKVIKENLKPQTLLVDFNPMRLFQMQEQKALVYNANADMSGNTRLKDRLQEELKISPVFTMNRNKIGRVEATDILDAIGEYNSNRSIADEAREVPVDLGLLNSELVKRVIESQAELGSKAGLTIQPFEGDGDEIDIPETDTTGNAGKEKDKKNALSSATSEKEIQILEKKLQTYYQRILFFSMLVPDRVRSLQDIVVSLDQDGNLRIARNLGLDAEVLSEMIAVFDPFKLNALDYKIQNISNLARDENFTPLERATRAMNKFSRISGSEVITPSWFCKDIVDQIPAKALKALIDRGDYVLDVASKSGEFALAIYNRLITEFRMDSEIIRDRIYSIPTSSIAYEFTRSFYEILGLNVENISTTFVSYDLVSDSYFGENEAHKIVSDKRTYIKGAKESNAPRQSQDKGSDELKFGAIVGNPPYQESDGGAKASARPIYQKFVELARNLEPEFMTFVLPTRWYIGGKGLDAFRADMISDPYLRELHDYITPETVFPGTNNRGGICYFLRDTGYKSNGVGTRVVTHKDSVIISDTVRPLNTLGLGVFLRDSIGEKIVEKVISSQNFIPFSQHVSPRKPFGLDGSIVKSDNFKNSPENINNPVVCYGRAKRVGYISEDQIRTNREWIDHWKVLTPYANNIGTELNDDNQNAFVVSPNSVCSETYLSMGIGLNLDKTSAHHLVVYLKTKFARFLHAQSKISQHGTKNTYQFVPTLDLTRDADIDWNTDTEAVDEQLFRYYAFSKSEREHIRSSIKPM